MYAVVNHLHLNIPVEELGTAIEQEGLPLLSGYPGFRDFYYIKAAEDRAIIIIVWETAAEAQNGAQKFGPTWFAQNIAPHLASEQQRSLGEVLVSWDS